jgi:tetratricopeptide (TPR) repeat protein
MRTNTIHSEETTVKAHDVGAIEEATLFRDLAHHARERCWPDRARRFATRALVILEREYGPSHPDVAAVLICRAGAREECADHGRAEADYRRAIDMLNSLTQVPGDLDMQRLRVRATSGLAKVMCALGRYREAEAMLKGALTMAEQTFGWKHGEAADVLNSLAALYREIGGFEKAFRLHRRALAIAETTLGPDHPTVATILRSLGVLEHKRDRLASAESFARRSLAIREKTAGPDHPHVASSASVLAGILQAQERFDEASSLYGRALTIYERWFGPDHQEVATTLSKMNELFRAWGQEARRVEPSVLAIPDAASFPENTAVGFGYVQPGALYHH